jgi:hypothetical protein
MGTEHHIFLLKPYFYSQYVDIFPWQKSHSNKNGRIIDRIWGIKSSDLRNKLQIDDLENKITDDPPTIH